MAKGVASILLSVLVVVFTCTNTANASHQLPVVNVAIVADGPSERVTSLRAVFLDEMRAVNRGEFNIQAPTDIQLDADRTLVGVGAVLDQVMTNPKTDLIVTLGVLASQAAAMRASLPKPVVAPLITNHGLQNVPYKDGVSGKHNLSYVSLDVDIERDLIAFREIVPFTDLAFIIDNAIIEAIPGIYDEVKHVARQLDITITPVKITHSAAPAISAISKSTQAVYVGPLPQLSADEYQQLVSALSARRLPSFAFEGKSDVQRGLLVGNAPALEMDRLARRVALNVRRILLGEDAAMLPVAFARAQGLTINMRTARAIGFSPNWRLLTRAELLYEAPDVAGPPLTFADAVHDAVERNLNMRISQSKVSAAKEDIRKARAALLPQIGLTGNGIKIDEDEAKAVPGRAERSTTGSITLEQSLYSEPAWANFDVQKNLQSARESEREQIRLDIILETAQTYLEILRAKTNERLQKNNLRLSRSNLDLARARRRIGTSGPSEVYRWESVIANAQRAVVEAQTQTKVAEIALNALLHKPLENGVVTVEVGLNDTVLIASQKRLFDLIDNPANFSLLRDFIVQDALSSVPELRQLDALIQAQQRTLETARRAYWQPTVSLLADRTETFARSGAQGIPLPGVDDSQTTIALQLSLPLFTSGSRGAQSAQANEALTGLRLQYQAIAERIEQRIRTALHVTRSAYTVIRLSQQAADAAENNLVVVRDAYSRGTVPILDLLDAQNAALVANLQAATAKYDFLRALMEVERAAARFDFFLTPKEQDDWFARVDRYFNEHGVPVLHH